MTYSDKFKDLHDLIHDVKSVITDLDDRDKMYAIIDNLIRDKDDLSYLDYEYSYEYSDDEVYAIIEDCGFDEDQLYLECGISGKYRIDVLAKLVKLVPSQLDTVKCNIENFEPDK